MLLDQGLIETFNVPVESLRGFYELGLIIFHISPDDGAEQVPQRSPNFLIQNEETHFINVDHNAEEEDEEVVMEAGQSSHHGSVRVKALQQIPHKDEDEVSHDGEDCQSHPVEYRPSLGMNGQLEIDYLVCFRFLGLTKTIVV